jgi:hypothetical protein
VKWVLVLLYVNGVPPQRLTGIETAAECRVLAYEALRPPSNIVEALCVSAGRLKEVET